MKPVIKVYDREGKDVTDERNWFLGMDGYLYFWESEVVEIDTEHHYEITMKVTEETIWRT